MITGIQLSIDLEREWQNNAGNVYFSDRTPDDHGHTIADDTRSFILIPMHLSGNYTHIYGFSHFILP